MVGCHSQAPKRGCRAWTPPQWRPSSPQGKAPKPSNGTNVRLVKTSEYSVAVRSFSGFPKPWKVLRELRSLWRALEDSESDIRFHREVRYGE